MRNYIKEYYFDLLKRMYQYMQLPEADIQKLTECQKIAIELGNDMEKRQISIKNFISLLENICELLYCISIGMNADQNRILVLNGIQKLEKMIRSEESEFEVLFLPYKVSMWDSFDSIYRQIKKEKKYNVSVVPIPYYYYNTIKSEFVLKYENIGYPEDIEIIRYKEYLLQKIKPDIIFIHNPYDDCNSVTRVCKEYYSSELIKYTNHLVYIPYFVGTKNYIGDENCQLPGVLNAWKVFVQSETMAAKYRKYNRSNKIIALGSPKIDMVIQKSIGGKEFFPAEWKSKLKNKKVFLYNTHISNIMNYTESYIKNLRYVYEVFKDNSDMGIIWRPHPLTQETIITTEPYILKDYIKIVEEFKQLPNAIFDECADIYASFAVADAYIGDNTSSLVPLFGITGRPMLFMNQTADCRMHRLRGVRSLCNRIVKNDMWLMSYEFNGLFRMNLKSRECSFEGIISEESSNQTNLYTDMVSWKNKLFLIPLNASGIAIFDMSEDVYKIRKLKLKEGINRFSVLVKNGKLWLFPEYFSSDLYCIDMENETIQFLDISVMNYLTNLKNLGNVQLFSGVVEVNNCAYRACTVGRYVFIYHFDTGELTYNEIRCTNTGFRDLCYDGENIWLLPTGNQNLIKWNPDTGETLEYDDYPSDVNRNVKEMFCRIIYHKGNILLIPRQTDKIVQLRTDAVCADDMQGISYMCRGLIQDYDGASIFRSYALKDEYLFLLPYESNGIVRVNLETKEAVFTEAPLPDLYDEKEWIANIAHRSANEGDTYAHVYKDSFCSLEDFTNVVKNGDDNYQEERKRGFLKGIINGDGSAGEKIWDYIKKEL